MGKIKILFIGDAVAPTGFARVLHSVAKFFPKDEVDISWLGVNYHGDPHEYPYRIYPASAAGGDLYGLGRLESILSVEKPDVIFLLNDIWILKDYLGLLNRIYASKIRPKIMLYFPIDAEDHDPSWYENMNIVDKAFTYTEFGKKVAEIACPGFKFKVVPHGTDSRIFYKIDKSRSEVRKDLFPTRSDLYDESTYIFLNGNRNQPRKKVDITIRAFTEFAKNKPPNVMLYLHMGLIDSHINIVQMTKKCGVDDRLIISTTEKGVQSLADDRLNAIYNSCDVGINSSVGEGWGLVNSEHAATGAPQIVPDHSALSDLYGDCGLLVPTCMSLTQDHISTTGKIVRPEDVAEKMELIYSDKELYKDLSEKSLKKFTSEKYSWETIAATFYKEIKGLL